MNVVLKIIKIVVISVLSLFVLFFVFSSNSNYKVDKEVLTFYKENKSALNELNANFSNKFKDGAYSEKEFEVNENGFDIIEKVYVDSESTSYIMNTNEFYQNGLMYTGGEKPIVTPVFDTWRDDLESENFRHINKNTYVLGKKNNGTDWYLCSYLGDGWFYYEIHSDI